MNKIAASLMSMLKTIVLSQVLAANKMLVTKVLIANKIGNVKSGDKLIEKVRKLLKTRKLSKS